MARRARTTAMTILTKSKYCDFGDCSGRTIYRAKLFFTVSRNKSAPTKSYFKVSEGHAAKRLEMNFGCCQCLHAGETDAHNDPNARKTDLFCCFHVDYGTIDNHELPKCRFNQFNSSDMTFLRRSRKSDLRLEKIPPIVAQTRYY